MALPAQALDDRDERTRAAYETFRAGFRGHLRSPPKWEQLDSWIRDACKVAYLQGALDGAFSSTHLVKPPVNESETQRRAMAAQIYPDVWPSQKLGE